MLKTRIPSFPVSKDGFGEVYQVAIFEMFMATSFRPEDSICVHVDKKAEPKILQAINLHIN